MLPAFSFHVIISTSIHTEAGLYRTEVAHISNSRTCNNLPILVENKYKVADGYSGNFYDINSGLIEGILYPALDPSIFEIKYPNADIKGKVLGDNLGITE